MKSLTNLFKYLLYFHSKPKFRDFPGLLVEFHDIPDLEKVVLNSILFKGFPYMQEPWYNYVWCKFAKNQDKLYFISKHFEHRSVFLFISPIISLHIGIMKLTYIYVFFDNINNKIKINILWY